MTTPTNSNSYPRQGGASQPVTIMNPDDISSSGGAGGATAANQVLQLAQETSTATNTAALVPTTDFDSKVGSLTETAPATDTASSGLNGRLQRIAQRISSAITLLAGGLPAALGSGGGLKVDGSGTALPVSGTVTANAGTGTLATSVADGSSVTIGALADAVVAAGATGSLSAKLRAISRDIVANIVLAAGSAIIGKVGVDQTTPGTTDRVTVGGLANLVSTPTLSVAGSYASGDYIGPSTTPASFTSVVRTSAGAGVLESIVITDKVVTAAVALELWLFNQTFTAPTDNAAWTVSDADALNCIGVIPLPSGNWYLGTVNKIFTLPAIALPFNLAVTTLFYALVARGTTPTWANGDLQLTVGVLQN